MAVRPVAPSSDGGDVVNLLAHALLSGPDTEVRLGNLLADYLKGRDRRSMSPAFLEGVRQHQVIDAFTDTHPIVSRSKARIRGYRHVTGILIDVFYDHFLSLRWGHYSSEPLGAFTARLYAELGSHPIPLPDETQAILDQLIGEDWLGSYASIEGIEDALGRISERLAARVGRDFELAKATSALLTNFDDLGRDFAEFFPLLQAYVSSV
jgi:acyl carrier protein phosphodiesterase